MSSAFDGFPLKTFWAYRNWAGELEIDEFGPGTLDGNPANGSSHDACGAAATEEVEAVYEYRPPTYSNIGIIRGEMLGKKFPDGKPLWDGGTTLAALRIEVPTLTYHRPGAPPDDPYVQDSHYHEVYFHDWQSTTLPGSVIGHACSFRRPFVVEVHNAAALDHNEPGVQNHFVAIGAWSTASDPNEPHLYVLNSDVARTYRPPSGGPTTGQWMTLSGFLKADPRGYYIFEPERKPVVTPPTQDIPGAIADLKQIQTLAGQASAALQQIASLAGDAIKKLGG